LGGGRFGALFEAKHHFAFHGEVQRLTDEVVDRRSCVGMAAVGPHTGCCRKGGRHILAGLQEPEEPRHDRQPPPHRRSRHPARLAARRHRLQRAALVGLAGALGGDKRQAPHITDGTIRQGWPK
jgi:hypothetical protein